MYAVTNLKESLHVTARYLRALWMGEWLKLGLVVLLIGGFGVTTQFFSVPVDPETIDDRGEVWMALLLLVAGFSIYAAFRYLAAVLEFVFVESLRSETMHLRRFLRANLGRGLRLLLFRAALWIALLAVVAVLVGATITLGDVGEASDLTSAQAAVLVLSGLTVFVGWYALYTLTTAFVVPIMLHEDRGAISATRQFVSSMATNWTGIVAFLFVAWVLGFTVWVFLFFLGFFTALFGVFAVVLLAMALEWVHPSLDVLALLLLLVGYVGYQYVVALVETAIRSYVRYFALMLLGDTESTLDLVSEQRGALRAQTTAAPADRQQPDSREPTDETRSVDAPSGTRTDTERGGREREKHRRPDDGDRR